MNKLFEHLKDINSIKNLGKRFPNLRGTFRFWSTNEEGSFEKISTLEGSRVLLPNFSNLKVLVDKIDAKNLIEGDNYVFKFKTEENFNNENAIELRAYSIVKPDEANFVAQIDTSNKKKTSYTDPSIDSPSKVDHSIEQKGSTLQQNASKQVQHPVSKPSANLASLEPHLKNNPKNSPPQQSKQPHHQIPFSPEEEEILNDFDHTLQLGEDLTEELIIADEEFVEIHNGNISRVDFIRKKLTKKVSSKKKKHYQTPIDPAHLKRIGNKGELYAYDILKEKFAEVTWMNQVYIKQDINTLEDSGEPYDFVVKNSQGQTIYIEVKSTTSDNMTFFLSNYEWHKMRQAERGTYQIYRVYDLMYTPNHIVIENPINALLDGKLVPYMLNQIREIDSNQACFSYVI